jgi:hypothetical protein
VAVVTPRLVFVADVGNFLCFVSSLVFARPREVKVHDLKAAFLLPRRHVA